MTKKAPYKNLDTTYVYCRTVEAGARLSEQVFYRQSRRLSFGFCRKKRLVRRELTTKRVNWPSSSIFDFAVRGRTLWHFAWKTGVHARARYMLLEKLFKHIFYRRSQLLSLTVCVGFIFQQMYIYVRVLSQDRIRCLHFLQHKSSFYKNY